MNFLELLNQNWIGSLIGLIGILAGIIFALIIYRNSRIGARLAYQRLALRLIGVKEQALPEEAGDGDRRPQAIRVL